MKESRSNLTRDVVLSLMRSRDDNMVLIASSLFLKLIHSAPPVHPFSSKEKLASNGFTSFSGKYSVLSLLIQSVMVLLLSESEFRLVTIKNLGNLLFALVDISGIKFEQLLETTRKDFYSGFLQKVNGLRSAIDSKQKGWSLTKAYDSILDEYEYRVG